MVRLRLQKFCFFLGGFVNISVPVKSLISWGQWAFFFNWQILWINSLSFRVCIYTLVGLVGQFPCGVWACIHGLFHIYELKCLFFCELNFFNVKHCHVYRVNKAVELLSKESELQGKMNEEEGKYIPGHLQTLPKPSVKIPQPQGTYSPFFLI